MALYRDQLLAILSLPMLRARFWPGDLKSKAVTVVPVEHDGLVAEVALVHEIAGGALTAPRLFLRCPACGSRANAVGCVAARGWGCRSCLGWRGRNVRVAELP